MQLRMPLEEPMEMVSGGMVSNERLDHKRVDDEG